MITIRSFLFMLCISIYNCVVPESGLCFNEECSEPISKAKTVLKYHSADADQISFRANADVEVLMKSVNLKPEVWLVKIDGNIGFAAPKFIKETKLFAPKDKLVPVTFKPELLLRPDKVKSVHEVIEGTTIYPDSLAEDQSTESNINSVLSDNSETEPLDSVNNNIDKSPLSKTLDVIDNNSAEKPNKATNNNDHVSEPPLSNEQLETETSSTTAPIITNKSEPEKTTEMPLILNQEIKTESVLNAQNIAKKELEDKEVSNLSNENISNPQQEKNYIEKSHNEAIKTDSGEPESNIEQQNETHYEDDNDDEEEENYEEDEPETEQDIPPKTQPIQSPREIEPAAQDILNNVTQVPKPQEALNDEIKNTNEVQDIKQVHTIIEPNIPNVTPENLNIQKENIEQQILHLPMNPNNSGADTSETNIPSNLPSSTPSPDIQITTETPAPTIKPIMPSEAQDTLPQTSKNNPVESTSNHNINIDDDHNSLNQDSTKDVIKNEAVKENIDNAYNYISSTENTDNAYNYISSTENTEKDISNSVPSRDPIFNTENNEILSTSTESTIDHISGSEIHDSYSTTPEPEINEPGTEVPNEDSVEESSDGFFENMLSTVSEMWASTTERPFTTKPSIDEHLDKITETPVYPDIREYPDKPNYEDTVEVTEKKFDVISYVVDMYMSVIGTNDATKSLFATSDEHCVVNGEYCADGYTDKNKRFVTFMGTAAVSIVLFLVGYYYVENKREDCKLVAMINNLQRDLLCAHKECELLKEELNSTKIKLNGIEDSSFGMDDMVQSLKEEIAELLLQNERLRTSLDDNEKLLRVSENTASELQNTMSEVENTLSDLLGERATSEEQIAELHGKLQAFEEELMEVSRERDSFQLKYASAEAALEETKKLSSKLDELHKVIKEANSTIDLQKHEISALKDALKEIKNGVSPGVDASALIDHTVIKAKLNKALEDKSNYENKYENEHKDRERLEMELKTAQDSLRSTNQIANEASTRLEVLGKYFQERENELMKELNEKEALYLSKKGESASTVEKIESLQQEIQRYKEKCDALTLEIAEQESAKRTALSELESRAHAAWLEARAAKRDAAHDREAAALLRRKLAALTQDGTTSPPHRISSPLEGGVGEGVMFLPPPLLPPPLPRPPPVGRLPSPHNHRYDRRYSPDSRYSPESRFSPESRYSPETTRYSPDTRYSPVNRSRRSPYSQRRRRSRDRYPDGRGPRPRNGPALETETEYGSDSPSRSPRRRSTRYSRSGPSSGSGCSSESDK